jgi:DnaJ-class molecular chaperone
VIGNDGRMRIPRGCVVCSDCKGTTVQLHHGLWEGYAVTTEVRCSRCGGTGYVLAARAEMRRRATEGDTLPSLTRRLTEA